MAGSVTPRARLVAALVVAGTFATRGVVGVVRGTAYSLGKTAQQDGRYERAAEYLDHAAVGFDRYDALVQRAEVRVGIYDLKTTKSSADPAVRKLLELAARDYFEAASLSPLSGQPWAGLAQVYMRVERSVYAERPVTGEDSTGWRDVGKPGRIAVGMLRLASERNPEVYTFPDQLVFFFLELGLRDEAIAAVREAAKAQPFFFAHAWDLPSFPLDLLGAFEEEARRSLGHAPMLKPISHLLSLGRMAHRLGRLEQAQRDLSAAVALHATPIDHAECAYYLARVEIDRGRYREAERALDVSERYPSLVVGSKDLRATIAEREGKLDEALGWLREARRLDAGSLSYCLRFATIARRTKDWSGATEALRWAILQHPEAVAPRAALVETYVDAGDPVAADLELEELRRVTGDTPETDRLRLLIARSPLTQLP
jgi:tetratricopeptide (TPR) repeat protein